MDTVFPEYAELSSKEGTIANQTAGYVSGAWHIS